MQLNRFALFVLLSALAQLLRAQSDSIHYYFFTMKNGKDFAAKVIEVKSKEYLRVQKTNDTIYKLDWGAFKNYEELKNVYSAKDAREYETLVREKKEARKALKKSKGVYESREEKHANWKRGLIINGSDTLQVRVNYINKKGALNDTYLPNFSHGFDPQLITVAYKSGEEDELTAENYDAILIESGNEWKKYVSICNDGTGCDAYRVLVDGKCLLLQNTMVGTGSMYAFYIFYKGINLRMRSENAPEVFGGVTETSRTSVYFKEKCRELFADCPSLVKKIDAKEYDPTQLPEIVKEFNACIAGNSQQK